MKKLCLSITLLIITGILLVSCQSPPEPQEKLPQADLEEINQFNNLKEQVDQTLSPLSCNELIKLAEQIDQQKNDYLKKFQEASRKKDDEEKIKNFSLFKKYKKLGDDIAPELMAQKSNYEINGLPQKAIDAFNCLKEIVIIFPMLTPLPSPCQTYSDAITQKLQKGNYPVSVSPNIIRPLQHEAECQDIKISLTHSLFEQGRQAFQRGKNELDAHSFERALNYMKMVKLISLGYKEQEVSFTIAECEKMIPFYLVFKSNYSEAIDLFENGFPDEAKEKMPEIIRFREKYEKCQKYHENQVGQIYSNATEQLSQNNFGAADQSFKLIHFLDKTYRPNEIKAYLQLTDILTKAEAALAEKQYGKAAALYEQAVVIRPAGTETHVGYINAKLGVLFCLEIKQLAEQLKTGGYPYPIFSKLKKIFEKADGYPTGSCQTTDSFDDIKQIYLEHHYEQGIESYGQQQTQNNQHLHEAMHHLQCVRCVEQEYRNTNEYIEAIRNLDPSVMEDEHAVFDCAR